MRRVLVGAMLAVLGGLASAQQTPPAQPPPSQQPPVTFRVETNFVEVDAIVTDEDGKPLPDLKQEEFQILEEGQPQTVAAFARVNIPITKPETTLLDGKPIPQDTATNLRGIEGRVYVLVLDDTHTHALRSPLVRRAANQFIEQYLGANDIAAVTYTSGLVEAAQEFTSNKRLLAAAVDKFMGKKIRSATAERLDEYNRQRGLPQPAEPSARPGRGVRDPLDFQRAYNARTALATLENIAKYLENVRGRRKAVIFFSEGIDYNVLDVMGDVQRNASDVLQNMRDAVAAATRSNVAFYAVDPRGLTALGDEGIELGAPPEDPAYGLGPGALQDELRQSQDSLRTLAEETGGMAAVNTNDFKTAYTRIVRDNSIYYVLGYYPKNERRDGRFRRIEVKVSRPNVKVFARKGYVASRPKSDKRDTPASAGTSAEVRELLNAPLPQAGITLLVHAAPFKGPGAKAMVPVTVQLTGRGLPFVEKDGLFQNKLELSMVAIDQNAKAQGGDRSELELKLRPQTYQLVQLTGLRSVSRLELPPGRYQLRIAARAVEHGELGSVFYDLDVPDFSKEKFSMSGILVTSKAAPLTNTPRLDPQVKDLLPTPPTANREFVTADTLTALAEVYDALQPSHKVDVTTRVRSIEGREVFRAVEERGSEELGGRKGGYGHLVNIPLTDLSPGAYVLQIDAKPRLDKAEAVSRSLSFRVERPSLPPPTAQADADAGVVPFRKLANGPQSNSDESRQVVIRSDEEWKQLWTTLPTKQAVPPVDFGKEMLVGVFLGSRPTGGYGVEVVGTRRDGEALVIEFTERKPDPSVMVTQQVTSPFVIARVLKHDGPVRFEEAQK